MELFRTTFQFPVSQNKISFNTPVIFTGSCFSEYIGNKLTESKIKTDNNPFGIVYNPQSLAKGLERLINPQKYSTENLFYHQGLYGSFDHHGRFSGLNQDDVLNTINNRLSESSQFLLNASFLFITLGTAQVYILKKTGEVVSNCHKFPAKDFEHNRLGISDIVDIYTLLFEKINKLNPGLKIIFTVSPVRHWKDGAHENQLSKSILLLAIDELVKKFEYVSYFPAYEWMMDDLRDYRFYEEDMLHPNKQAVNYIWEKFTETYFDEPTIQVLQEIKKITQAVSHKPFNPKSKEFKEFACQQLNKINGLTEKFEIQFNSEIEYFKQFCK